MSEVAGSAFTVEDTEQSIAARFEAQVAAGADRPAVVDKGGVHTYEELNRRANQIARAIREHASGEPVRVGIYLEKGFEYIAAIFGVLKAGHAYVPIDPAFPEDRNRYILQNSEVAVVLTTGAHGPALEHSEISPAKVLLESIDEQTCADNLNLDIPPDAIAYIIYTSGSTGRPKGVVQNQRNTLHGCMRRTHLQRITPADRMSLFYSCTVMGSVYCIFGALLNGAALLPYDFREEGLADLADWLVKQRVTIYHSVASVFRQFVAHFDGAIEGSCVRLVIFGGERVLTSDIEAARRVFSERVHFFTGLGSTETGTVRQFLISPETALRSRVVPIGYSVDGVEIVLTDEHGRVVPDGEIGEINVQSRYVALGYYNDEEATRRVFSEVPGQPGVRRYCMGDLAQLQAGGLLEHRGRKDFQVKIRGFRVEVGEVESALQSHPLLAEGLVAPHEVGDELQLVGYVVPAPESGEQQLTVRVFTEYLRERLPSYMVPTVFVLLDAIPRTPNGKVDRKALPPPLPSNELTGEERVPAENETEAALVEIFSKLLRRSEIGTNQNFFDLGGDSLSATQLLARIFERFSVKLSMKAVFAAADLKALAAEVAAAKTTTGAQAATGLQRVPRNERIPATPAQRRMWLVDRLYASSSAYNISNAVRLRGELDVGALERALNEVVSRHDTLRTVFRAHGQDCWQEVHAFEPFKLSKRHLEGLCAAEREQRMQECLRLGLERNHDLATGPLFTCELFVLAPDEHVLALVFNHIIYDNIWSSRIFFQELGALYAHFREQGAAAASPLAALPFQFADYAHWEQRRVTEDRFEAQIEYWRQQLASPPPPLTLPSDRPRPETPSFAGGQIEFVLPPYLRLALAQFSRKESATIFMSMLAAWQLLLARYSGQDDVLVGTPTGRRYQTQTENMIGLFINNLVMRSRLSADMTFRQLLAQVRQTAIDAFSHDELPFEKLVEVLRPPRQENTFPYFQHFFIHRNATNARWEIPGQEVEPLRVHPGGSKFDLTLSVLEDEQLSATIEYAKDLFERETVERLAANYVQLLEAALEEPDRPVSRLHWVSHEETALLVERWNPPPVEYPSSLCTHHLFEQRVKEQPDAVAVIAEDETLSYAELNRRANAVAARLRSMGVGANSLVGVCLHRSSDLLVALLGVMKSGGAYVPLDPGFPSDRIRYMLEDSGARVLLTERACEAELLELPAQRIFVRDHLDIGEEADAASGERLRDRTESWQGEPSGEWPLIAEDKQEPSTQERPLRAQETTTGRQPAPSRQQDLAYVIYTSGSTGKPKGVQLTHCGLTNFLCSMQREPGLSASDVVQSLTTISFDIAALELYLPLIVGARVVICGRETSMSPRLLMASMQKHGVTFMQATPVTWRMLLEAGWEGAPKIKVLCGGEAMGANLAERLIATGCEIWNMYGPTETTIWSTAGKVQTKEDAGFIGKPIANTQLYVMSPEVTLQPVGVPGELLIGGDGLARGYLGKPELTAERFVADPWHAGQRLYRTGDLVVRRPGGAIEFLGRIDNQVKVRGFRIELGEIEAVLAQLPGVKEAVVVARPSPSGENELAAYVIPSTGSLDIAALRAGAAQQLPAYMVPSYVVQLKEYPLTPNGKVDRKALPTPTAEVRVHPEADTSQAPRSPAEELLQRIWERVLGVQRPGIHENFYELGGHSLQAVHIVDAAAAAGLVISPLQFFRTPTIAGLAEAASSRTVDGTASTLVKLREGGEQAPLFVFHSTPGDVVGYAELVWALPPGRPVYGLQALGLKDPSRAHTTIEAMAAYYVDEIRRVHPKGPYHLAGWCFGGTLALEVAQQFKRQGAEVGFVALMETTPKVARDRAYWFRQLSLMARMGLPGARVLKDGVKARMLGQRRADLDEEVLHALSLESGPFKHRRAVHRINYEAVRAHRTQYYDGKLTLIKALYSRRGVRDPDYGWGSFVAQAEIHEYDSDHVRMLKAPLVEAVAATMESAMKPWDARTSVVRTLPHAIQEASSAEPEVEWSPLAAASGSSVTPARVRSGSGQGG